MSITRVQYASNGTTTGATTLTATLGTAATAGNLLVAIIGVGSTASQGSCSTPAGWSLAVGPVGDTSASPIPVELYIFYKIAAGGETGITATDTVSSGISIEMWEWSSTTGWLTSPVDQTASSAAQAATTTPVSGTTSTTTQANELWIGAISAHKSTEITYSSPSNGFTQETEAWGGGSAFYAPNTGAFYKVVSSTGAASVSATASISTGFGGAIATFMPSPVVQTVHSSGTSGTSASATLASTTAGNLLVALVTAAKNPGDVTFTAPANWVQDGTTQHDDAYVSDSSAVFYYPDNPGSITSVSFTMDSAPSSWTCTLIEISGVATSSPTDGILAAVVGSTGRTTGNLTTTTNGDLILGFAVIDAVEAGAPTFTEATGYTQDVNFNDGGGWFQINVAYQIQVTAGAIAYAPTWTTIDDATLYVAAFKPASSGGGTVSGGGSLVSNSAITESAQIVAPGTLQSNSALSAPAQLVSSAALPSNSVLDQLGAQIVTSADLIANALLGSSILQGGGALVGNAVLRATASIVSSGVLQSNSALSAPAQVVSGCVLQSNAVLELASADVLGFAALVSNAILTGFSGAPPPLVPRKVIAWGPDGKVTAWAPDGNVIATPINNFTATGEN
jgi:trimeric autotransporter adhesin